MIIYINGNIGSGKTSLAVAFLYSFFPNKVYDSMSSIQKKFFPSIKGIKRDKFKIYTNISGFKFEDFDGKAEFLNFDILSECSKIHYELHSTNKDHHHIDKAINSFFDQCALGVEYDDLESDLDLRKIKRKYNYIKGFQFNHIVLMIDEVADFFVENEPHLDKWFNYSRHLFQDMILIQNDLSSIDRSYKNDNVVSYYIKAAEAENRLHPQLFKYAFFRKWTQPATDKPPIKMFWLPKWIFKKYDSGQIEKAFPKIILYLIPFIFLLLFVAFQLYSLIFSDEVVEDAPAVVKEKIVRTENNVSQNVDNNQEPLYSQSHKSIACFNCRSDTCFYKKDIFSSNRLGAYMKFYNFEFLYKDNYKGFSKFCFAVDDTFLELYAPKKVESSLGNKVLMTSGN